MTILISTQVNLCIPIEMAFGVMVKNGDYYRDQSQYQFTTSNI